MRASAPLLLLCLVSFSTAGASSGPGTIVVQPPPSWQARDQRPVFSANVEMVTVNVAVFDSEDRPVAGLTAEDFVLREDGVELEVELALAPEDTSLDIAFVLDFSGSIGRAAPYAQAAEIAFLEALSPEDCVFVLPFNHGVGPGVWGRSHDPALGGFIRRTVPRGGTALYDAMLRGLSGLSADTPTQRVRSPGAFHLVAEGQGGIGPPREFADRIDPADDSKTASANGALVYRADHDCAARVRNGPTRDRRRAMVVLTDGLDTHSRGTHRETLAAIAVGAGAAVSPVGFSRGRGRMPFSSAMEMRRLEAQWREFARVSGGEFIKGTGPHGRLNDAYDEALGLLRASYVIGYRSPSVEDSGHHLEDLVWHRIEVEMRDGDLRAVAPEGHYRSGVDRDAAQAAVASASQLLEDGRPEVALTAVDRAVTADPFFWKAHYYRGIALGLLERWEAAGAAAERAVELNPGNERARELAWLVAYTLGDDRTAWEHAIRAQRAGRDMTEAFELLRRRGAAPAESQAILEAPKVFVGDSENDDGAVRATLKRVYRGLRRALAATQGIVLVDDPFRASFLVGFQDEELDDDTPRGFEGELTLYEVGGNDLWKRDVEVNDIDEPAALERALRPAVAQLQERLTEER